MNGSKCDCLGPPVRVGALSVEQGVEISRLDDGRVIWSIRIRITVRIIITAAIIDYAVMLGKRPDLGAPFPIIAESAVDENNWDAAALFQVMQLDIIDADDLERTRKPVDVTFLRCKQPERQQMRAQQGAQLDRWPEFRQIASKLISI